VAFGLDYGMRRYMADRGGLENPNDLDMPDVEYKIISPNASLRIPFGLKTVGFGALGAFLITDTGPIQGNDSYGPATVYGGELALGFDYALTKLLALRVAGELTQINFKFNGTGAAATGRGVTGATDRTFGIAATLAVKY
jgi:hypothetical protein